ncbi:hypothetical protein LSH36_366g04046 [Paralvinella palmiformis]|uniref:Uncharacterized protein n=1 Tax=Paralvinella palmiformis TaxID=53620 RepID=A0AAD9JDV6_9ANNE|nr:hypothetical protein LSH36_366g04046 [Paralvinella palmiformis]
MSDKNEQNTEDLPEETIIIVGVVCGSIVIILTIVLIVLCCKRQQTKQQYEKQQENHTSTALGSDPSLESTDGVKPPLKSGLDNPGLDQTDSSLADLERSRDTPFVTNASGHPHDGYSNHWNSHDHNRMEQNHHEQAPPAYPASYNMAKERNDRDSHPIDQQKVKKVIYEVVV